MNDVIQFGAGRSSRLACRIFGCRPRRDRAIVRVRLHRPGGGRVVSHLQTVKACRRCDLVRTVISVEPLDGEWVDWVSVEPEVLV